MSLNKKLEEYVLKSRIRVCLAEPEDLPNVMNLMKSFAREILANDVLRQELLDDAVNPPLTSEDLDG